ncbi:MAG: NRDE family protein [Saprospiraceae bacterium]|nr:NRDE family protein [Saprospiraceae bacterium]
MCTVTYIGQDNKQFVLTSNRDVHATRSPKTLSKKAHLIFGEDVLAGGTWMAASDKGKVVCLLNGAFENHLIKPLYRMSRGVMVLQYFDYENSMDFIHQFDFQNIEPFTMILIDTSSMIELRWNGYDKIYSHLNLNGNYIWSSSTLYTYATQQERAVWFKQWLQAHPDPNWKDIWDFHENGGKKDAWNGFIMNRNGKVQTVSTTSIERKDHTLSVRYFDRISPHYSEAAFVVSS